MKRSLILTAALIIAMIISLAPVFAADLQGEDDAMIVDRNDGEYTIEVTMEGGTGRAEITSPATMIVQDNLAWARIEWDSPHYDYMIVNGQKYLPVNKGGNSVFEIPIMTMDKPMTVIGDTTAMSEPHEIEYELTFDSKSVSTGADALGQKLIMYGGIAVVALIIIAIFVKRGTRKR